MTNFILDLSLQGLLVFSAFGTFVGYFLSLAISKSNLPAVAGAIIRIAIIVMIFWDARIDAIEAKTIGDIAFNLEILVSTAIFMIGAGIGLICALKLTKN